MAEPALNSMEPEKAFILRFKNLPVLWDPSNPNYTNKYKRIEAYTKLVPVLRRVKPGARTDDVRRKINTLRSNYRRELRKILISKSDDSEAVYTPKNWLFHHLSFLGTLDIIEPGGRLRYGTTEEPDTDSESEEPRPLPIDVKQEVNPSMKETKESLRVHEEEEHIPNSESKNLVIHWVNTLDRLDPMQRLYAKKAINDILFEAELGNLTRYSVSGTNEPGDPISPPSQFTE